MIFEGNFELPSLEFIEDEGKIRIWGRSISTNAKEDFWQPLINKLEEYLWEPRDMEVSIDMDFFATSSAKQMLALFNLLVDKCIKMDKRALIEWVYEDEEMLEAGEDYSTMNPKLEWKFTKK